jgi:phosphoribosyl 1,2-cyclic phosphodiesterase
MILPPGRAGLKVEQGELRFAVLGSGSSANGFIFEYGEFSFLVDNGYSLAEFRRRMKTLQFRERHLAFIFLTHLHSDHFKGVEPLSRALNIPVVTHERMPVEQSLKQEGLHRLDICTGKEYAFRSLRFRAFDTFHDAPNSIGFHFHLGGTSFTLITDTGCLSEEMEQLASDSDYLFLESNYSPDLLHRGAYPQFLKNRILSDRGHLSNLDAATFMVRLAEKPASRLKKIFLCHLSEKNNTVEKVKEEVGRIYDGAIPYSICPRNDCLSHDLLVTIS